MIFFWYSIRIVTKENNNEEFRTFPLLETHIFFANPTAHFSGFLFIWVLFLSFFVWISMSDQSLNYNTVFLLQHFFFRFSHLFLWLQIPFMVSTSLIDTFSFVFSWASDSNINTILAISLLFSNRHLKYSWAKTGLSIFLPEPALYFHLFHDHLQKLWPFTKKYSWFLTSFSSNIEVMSRYWWF